MVKRSHLNSLRHELISCTACLSFFILLNEQSTCLPLPCLLRLAWWWTALLTRLMLFTFRVFERSNFHCSEWPTNQTSAWSPYSLSTRSICPGQHTNTGFLSLTVQTYHLPWKQSVRQEVYQALKWNQEDADLTCHYHKFASKEAWAWARIQLLVLSAWIFCVRSSTISTKDTQYCASGAPSKSLKKVSMRSFTSAFFSSSACTSESSRASIW